MDLIRHHSISASQVLRHIEGMWWSQFTRFRPKGNSRSAATTKTCEGESQKSTIVATKGGYHFNDMDGFDGKQWQTGVKHLRAIWGETLSRVLVSKAYNRGQVQTEMMVSPPAASNCWGMFMSTWDTFLLVKHWICCVVNNPNYSPLYLQCIFIILPFLLVKSQLLLIK